MHLVAVPVGLDPELTADALWARGALGVEDVGGELRGVFATPTAATSAAAALGGRIETVAATSGFDAWRDHASIHRAGPFAIRPPWIDVLDGARDLVIDPHHAFGSGSHVSTRLAIELLAVTVRPGDDVLDIGTGSGILAIAAALLGASVTAVDNDPNAAAAVAANTAANGVTDQVDYHQIDAGNARGRCDVIVCNVTIDLHETIGPALAATSSTALIAAGLLVGPHEQRAMDAYRRNQIVDRRVEGEWAAIAMV